MHTIVEKLQIACELLEAALVHYYDEKPAYFASLHLAGGADVLLGAYVEFKQGGVPQFDQFKKLGVKFSEFLEAPATEQQIGEAMNRGRNGVKHMDSASNDTLFIYAKREAKDMLTRAVYNYYALMETYELPETPLIRRFNLDQAALGE